MAGLRGTRGVAAPPYTAGPYTWDQKLSFTGARTPEGWDSASVLGYGTLSTPINVGTVSTDDLVINSVSTTGIATGQWIINNINNITTYGTSTGYFLGSYNYIQVAHSIGAAFPIYAEVDVTATAALNGNVSGLYSEMQVTGGVITGAGKISGLLVEMNVTAGVTIAQPVHGIEVDMRDVKADIAGEIIGIKVTMAGGTGYIDYGMQFSNCFNNATAVINFDLTQGNTAAVMLTEAGGQTITNWATFTNSTGSITNLFNFAGYGTGEGEIIEADGAAATGAYGKLKIITCDGAAGYINVYTTPN